MIRALKQLGVTATFREGLGWSQIARELAERRPVILTIKPGNWAYDHWEVMRGLQPRRRRVLLTNYGPFLFPEADKDGGIAWKDFRRIWFGPGEVLLCST